MDDRSTAPGQTRDRNGATRQPKPRYIYAFADGSAEMVELLGGKGAGLAEMTGLGLPVPPGFTLTTRCCNAYLQSDHTFPPGLDAELEAALDNLQQQMGRRLGDEERPLLVSVRSGAAVSMPGMMDTILNVGLNDTTVAALAAESAGGEVFALDCYRRLIQMFGSVVLKVPEAAFEAAWHGLDERERQDPQVLGELVDWYKGLVQDHAGEPFPQDPVQQVTRAVEAVFRSWRNERAGVYRRAHGIPGSLGTAATVQAMVFGNLGDDSGTGVLFTRNPNTGEAELYGEFLENAQGEDVVAGRRTPWPLERLRQRQPQVYRELAGAAATLERHRGDMQDIEFTVQQGRLFLLQTRAGKRTGQAAVRIAHDLVAEGRIDEETALLRLSPEDISGVLHQQLDQERAPAPLGEGLPASPGAAVGRLVLDARAAEARAAAGEDVILVRPDTTPEDIQGVLSAQGVLTQHGGMTCHAAIVARGLGRPCVVGCEELAIDEGAGSVQIGGQSLGTGEWLSIDGTTGRVYPGQVPVVAGGATDELITVLNWASQRLSVQVRANADTGPDAARARAFGAAGVGLCRTEHMFMQPQRLELMQQVILADSDEERRQALSLLLPLHRQDIQEVLAAMDGQPVAVRLLDPPLHEFLPDTGELPAGDRRLARVRSLMEANPMLGHRGCRLGVTFPEIYRMQARAVFEAAASLRERGVDARPEVMVPLVSHVNELRLLRQLVAEVAGEVSREYRLDLPVRTGTMMETPRACLTAGQLAEQADFFSFGTNDLTQTTFGFSRDDAEAKFLHEYLQKEILPANPFVTLDPDGVGRLMDIAVREGRRTRRDLSVGVCGEHAGDPDSVALCRRLGLDYVSCSPFRVPIAVLVSAQLALKSQ